MQKIKVKVFAKINLSLDVVGKRENGYHDLTLVNQSISLFDELTIEPVSQDIILKCPDSIPTDHTNSAYRAARAYLDAAGISQGVSISIEKNIPVAAGLGGSAADAAAVLFALNEIYEALSSEQLIEIGVKIGADVPFMMYGGTMLCTGVGEIMEPLEPIQGCEILIVKPLEGMDTGEAFKDYDMENAGGISPEKTDHGIIIKRALAAGDLDAIAANLHNDLQAPVVKKIPKVGEIIRLMKRMGAKGVSMSGSGSAVFGIFDDDFSLQICRDVMSSDYEGAGIYDVTTVDKGCIREL